jgi:hypothetical protein
MITHDTRDPVRLCGIRHFIETQGLPTQSDSNGLAGIVYGNSKSPYEHTLRVMENPNDETDMIMSKEAGTFIEEKDGEITVGFDAFAEIGHILGGCAEGKKYAQTMEKNAKTPFLDLFEELLFQNLKKVHFNAGLPLVRKAMWPDGRRYTVCLTHDVDEVKKTYQHLTSPVKYLLLRQFKRAIRQLGYSISDVMGGRDPYWTFEELIRLEKDLGVKSSLYFLQEKGKFTLKDLKSFFLIARRYEFSEPKIAAIIRRLDEGGWDIGVHGSYNSHDNQGLFNSEKQSLETVLGHPTIGTRQHHLNLTIPKTWRIHEACGLSYDCSLGLKGTVGFRWGTCFPFQPFDAERNQSINILEMPTAIMDTPLFYIKGDAWAECSQVMDQVRRCGGLLTLLWHHTVFNEREFPGWIGRYGRIISSAQADGAWVTHCRDIASWWSSRMKAEMKTSTRGNRTTIACPSVRGLNIEVFTPKNEIISCSEAVEGRYGGAFEIKSNGKEVVITV